MSEKVPTSNTKVIPEPGCVVKVRSRRYLVEAVEPARQTDWEQTLVDLSCLEDDAGKTRRRCRRGMSSECSWTVAGGSAWQRTFRKSMKIW
jgi:hypothetical protein